MSALPDQYTKAILGRELVLSLNPPKRSSFYMSASLRRHCPLSTQIPQFFSDVRCRELLAEKAVPSVVPRLHTYKQYKSDHQTDGIGTRTHAT
jgi:hypothetical protein